MTRYENGRAPLNELVYLGPQFYLPHGTAARYRELQRLGVEKYGVRLYCTDGWNGYRPLSIQYEYREELGVWAAVPGYSSHGLTYQGRDCAAVDINNWRALAPDNESLAWSRFVALCRLVGFTVDFVTPQELWHIGDFDPFTVIAFASIVIKPATTARPEPPEEEETMTNIRRHESRGQVYAFTAQGVRHVTDNETEAVERFVQSVAAGRDPYAQTRIVNLGETDFRRYAENRGLEHAKIDALAPGDFLRNDGTVITKPVW